METFLTIISIIFESISIAFLISIFIRIMDKDKSEFNLKKILLSLPIILFIFLINNIITVYFTSLIWIKSILFMCIGPIISLYIYKSTIFKGFCTTVIISMISALINIIVILFSKRFLSLEGFDLFSNDIYLKISTLVISLFEFLTFIVIQYIFNIFKTKKKFSFFNTKYIVPQLITMAICMLPSMFVLMDNDFKYSSIFILVNFLQLLVISVMSMFNSRNAIRFEHTEEELYNTNKYNETLLKVNEGVRGFKHDMTNIVQAILGYLACKDYEGAKKYCENLVVGFNDINILSILSPTVINDPAIYGVVVSKILTARDKEINLSLDVNLDVNNINFPKFELSRTLGILLDNAIEAGEKTKDKKLVLKMYTNYLNNTDIIIISNSIKNTKIDVSKLFEKNYSTKKDPSGFGLYAVSKFFNKYTQGNITTSIDYDKKMLTQTIVIKRQKETKQIILEEFAEQV